MGRKVKSYTEEYKNTIIDLFNSGKTYAEISDEYGVPKTTIRQWVKKEWLNWNRKMKYYTKGGL